MLPAPLPCSISMLFSFPQCCDRRYNNAISTVPMTDDKDKVRYHSSYTDVSSLGESTASHTCYSPSKRIGGTSLCLPIRYDRVAVKVMSNQSDVSHGAYSRCLRFSSDEQHTSCVLACHLTSWSHRAGVCMHVRLCVADAF